MSQKFKPNFNRSESGLFAPRYDNDPTRCDHHIEAIKHLIKCCDIEFTIEEVWEHFDNLEFSERVKKNNKKKKRLNKKENNFKPVNITKPLNTLNVYRSKYKESNETYNADEFYKQYAEDKESNSDLYQECVEEAQRQKNEYQKLVDEQQEEHIYTGQYVPKPPKAVCNEYIILTNAFRREDDSILDEHMKKDLKTYKTKLKKEHKNDPSKYNLEFMKGINVLSKKYWDKLGGKEHKYQPLKDAHDIDKLRLKCQRYEYELIVAYGKLQKAKLNTEDSSDSSEVEKLENEYNHLLENKPDNYDDYTELDNYEPLYNFTEHIDI